MFYDCLSDNWFNNPQYQLTLWRWSIGEHEATNGWCRSSFRQEKNTQLKWNGCSGFISLKSKSVSLWCPMDWCIDACKVAQIYMCVSACIHGIWFRQCITGWIRYLNSTIWDVCVSKPIITLHYSWSLRHFLSFSTSSQRHNHVHPVFILYIPSLRIKDSVYDVHAATLKTRVFYIAPSITRCLDMAYSIQQWKHSSPLPAAKRGLPPSNNNFLF